MNPDDSVHGECAKTVVAACERTWSFEQPGIKKGAEEISLREYCRRVQTNLDDQESPLNRKISSQDRQRLAARLTAVLTQLRSPVTETDRRAVSRARAEIESLVLQAQTPTNSNGQRELAPFVAISVGNTLTVSACYRQDEVHLVRNDDDGELFLPSYPTSPNVFSYMPNPSTAPVSPVSAARRLLEPTHRIDAAASRDFPTLFRSADPYEQQMQSIKLFARIFRRILASVEAQELGKVYDGVLVVPTNFSWHQRERLRRAAAFAGLVNVLSVSDAIASAVCHLGEEIWSGAAKQTAMVLHVGGHTIDAAVLTGRNSVLKLRAVAGYREFGGEQLTNRLVQHCSQEFLKRTGYNLLESDNSRCRISLCRLRRACEEAKRLLSAQPRALIEVPNLLYDKDYRFLLERSLLEELSSEFFLRCLTAVSAANAISHISKRAINHVILEGGGSVIPRLRDMLVSHFEGRIIHLHCNHTNSDNTLLQVHPAHAQAVGAVRFQQSALMEARSAALVPVETATDYARIFTYRKGRTD